MATPGATERSFCEEPDKLPPRKRSKPHRMPLPFACCGGEGVCPSQAPQEAPKAPDWPIQFWGRGFGPFWVFPAPALQFGPSIPGGRSSFIELLLGLNQSGRGAGSARGSDEWRILAGSIELPSDGFPRHQRPAGASDCGWSLELLKRARAHPAQCCLQSQLILYCQCLAFPFLQCLLLRFQNPRCHRIPPCGSIFVSAPGCWRSGGSCSGPGLRPFVGLWSLQEGQLLPLGHPVGFWKACFSFLVG
ncbi:uncharacterized protein LOC128322256 isoform X2 [Hemicordylus capensis]|uniref:uncharacterized protein LOC128322256 isoform X2 n=1 Tax=Hemicordylus capensis TaxID=884348 RepID=UPI0023038025|nr:uncharacterized protein LOC128322256 isoform X2 [Hemicordylus capensis]